jgi:hypothetical protein
MRWRRGSHAGSHPDDLPGLRTRRTTGRELLDPMVEINARRFPTMHWLAAGLAEDRWEWGA